MSATLRLWKNTKGKPCQKGYNIGKVFDYMTVSFEGETLPVVLDRRLINGIDDEELKSYDGRKAFLLRTGEVIGH